MQLILKCNPQDHSWHIIFLICSADFISGIVLVLADVFIASYRIAKCIREIVFEHFPQVFGVSESIFGVQKAKF